MIDDPWKTGLLISMLKELLPVEANITQYLAGALMEKSPDMTVPKKCNVTRACRQLAVSTFGRCPRAVWLGW